MWLSSRQRRKLLKADRLATVFALIGFVFVPSLNLYADDANFGSRVDLGIIEHDAITEASGLAVSRKNTGVFWTHNDSGDMNRLYAFNSQGRHLGVYYVYGASAVDWEDMAIGPGPVDGEEYLYIGDIGDNAARRDLKQIYRALEPEVDANQAPVSKFIAGAEKITFRYPDGNRDAETVMVDPLTKDIYVVSKRERNVRVYRAPYPQSTTDPITLEHVATLDLGNVGAGDISRSGLEILLKTYGNIYYWSRTPAQKLWQAFEKKPVRVPYLREPQGEAIGWAPDGMGYYTVSEEPAGIPAHLYFYPRLNPEPIAQEPTPIRK